jgi:hypothetical protein
MAPSRTPEQCWRGHHNPITEYDLMNQLATMPAEATAIGADYAGPSAERLAAFSSSRSRGSVALG